jgi:hypothetical protein
MGMKPKHHGPNATGHFPKRANSDVHTSGIKVATEKHLDQPPLIEQNQV